MLGAAFAQYEVGDVVANCTFEDSSGNDTGCENVELWESTIDFEFADSSESADTGPSGDHTSGDGKCHNTTG